MVTTRSQAAAQRAPCQGPGHVPCPKVQPSPQSLPGIGGCDPLEALGCDLLGHVLQFLGPVHLLQASLVSKQWQAVAYEEQRWQQHCQELWAGKVYVPPAAPAAPLCWRQRYAASLQDAARTRLEQEELCAFRWTFRFKRTAGEFWVALDPFWNAEGDMMRRFFHDDGSISAQPDDPLWGEHEIRWRFTKSQGGRRGHYVKVNHWPSLSISRRPDWGWRMENLWVVYEAELLAGGPYQRGVAGAKHHTA